MSYFDAKKPRVFGHRGAAGLAPENTLPSFALAHSLGAAYLELDVHASRDGAVVVIHDATLERTSNGTGLVREHSLAALQRLDAGYAFTWDGRSFPYRGQNVRIPTLDAVLRRFGEALFNIEIKQGDPPIVDAVLDVLERTQAVDRVLLAAEHQPIMDAIRAAAGERIPTSMSAFEVATFMDHFQRKDWSGYRTPARALQIPPSFANLELVSAETLAVAHDMGLEMHVWTINDRAEMERLLALGVDGIMSDLPGLAVAVAEAA